MILDTFAKPNDTNVISADYTETHWLGKVRITIHLELSCWVGSGKLAITVDGKGLTGGRYVSRKRFKTATYADLQNLIKRIRLEKCSTAGCKSHYLKTDDLLKINPDAYCSRHFYTHLRKGAAIEEVRVQTKETFFDNKNRAKGYRYKAIIWIHRATNRDDYFVRLYYKNKPRKKDLANEALSRMSKIIDDYQVFKL